MIVAVNYDLVYDQTQHFSEVFRREVVNAFANLFDPPHDVAGQSLFLGFHGRLSPVVLHLSMGGFHPFVDELALMVKLSFRDLARHVQPDRPAVFNLHLLEVFLRPGQLFRESVVVL